MKKELEYRIAGIYPIDRETRKEPHLGPGMQQEWMKFFLIFEKVISVVGNG